MLFSNRETMRIYWFFVQSSDINIIRLFDCLIKRLIIHKSNKYNVHQIFWYFDTQGLRVSYITECHIERKYLTPPQNKRILCGASHILHLFIDPRYDTIPLKHFSRRRRARHQSQRWTECLTNKIETQVFTCFWLSLIKQFFEFFLKLFGRVFGNR